MNHSVFQEYSVRNGAEHIGRKWPDVRVGVFSLGNIAQAAKHRAGCAIPFLIETVIAVSVAAN